MNDEVSRRRLLAASATTLGGLAGCSQRRGVGSPASTASRSGADDAPGGPFEQLSMSETTLVIELREDAQVEQVNVLAPNGSRVSSKSVVSGQTRVTVDLGVEYTPGTYEITTEAGESASISLEPDLVILELGVGANNLNVMPDSLDNFEPYAATVVVRNLGTGPAAIQDLAFGGDIPNTSEDIIESNERSGIVDPATGSEELERVFIASGASVRLFSSTLPFLFAGQAQTCSTMPEDSIGIVRISDSVTGDITQATFELTYQSAGDGCEISIKGKEA